MPRNHGRSLALLGSLLVLLALAPVPGRAEAAPALSRITDELYLVRDVCNVYLLKRGDRALLIDAGDARVLELTDRLGIKRIDWVLQTHAHRDQCQGAPRLAAQGTRIAVPANEQRFFTDAEGFWDNFALFYRYFYKPDQFKPRENIPVHRALKDGEVFEWEGLRIEALETPGHSLGALSYLLELDGRRYAFTGDMIHSPGRVWNLYHFDHHYWDGGFKGVVQNRVGLERVLARKPELLLPSHGEPIADPAKAVALLQENLEALYDFDTLALAERETPGPRQPQPRLHRISEHLYHLAPTNYLLISENGNALLYDYLAVSNPHEFYHYDSLPTELAKLGVKNIEVATLSHFHEDHVRGLPDLKQRYGAEIWLFENMADIMEHPSRYNLPCLAEESIVADRVLHDGETIRWREYEFKVVHFPGQTMYHMALEAMVDGRRVMFCGDSDVYLPHDPNLIHRNRKLHGISTFLNYYQLEPGLGYLRALDRLLELEPELLLFAHSGAPGKPCSREMLLANRRELEQRLASVARVLPYEDPNLGFDPNWVCWYPFSAKVQPGEALEAEVRVRNHLPRPMQYRLEPRLPQGWSCEPPLDSLRVAGKGEGVVRFTLRVPAGADLSHRRIVTVDVADSERHWGELAEMLLERR